MKSLIRGSVAGLPNYAFGAASLGWWGTIGFMLIEGMAFVLAIGAYFYLMPFETRWPPASPPPDLRYGTAFTALILLSELPNAWVERAAKRFDIRTVRIVEALMLLIGVALLALRALEFTTLNERWDHNAYASIVWALMLIHTTHIATDVFETGVLTVLIFVKTPDGRRLSDVTDGALYWHFVALAWMAIYLIVYWVPRVAS